VHEHSGTQRRVTDDAACCHISGMPVGVPLVDAAGDDARLLRTAKWLVARLAQ
jgi:Asp-tRNA(Asn)/Glu-tRNA(Gln) amidotransferase A subunit family amidase